MFPEDSQYDDYVIESVKQYDHGWSIEIKGGWSFYVPASSPVVPVPGMVARFYGRGIGYYVRGLFIDNQQVFYRKPASLWVG